jgi:hypothetical protein
MGANYCIWFMIVGCLIGSYVIEGSTNDGISGVEGEIHVVYAD